MLKPPALPWSSSLSNVRSSSTLAAPASIRARRLRVGSACSWEVFGPCPPEPVPTPEEIWAEEFTREMQGDVDPRLQQHGDKLRSYRESGDWRGACGVIEDMWNGKLEPDAWMYSLAIEVCDEANETESAEALRRELDSWAPFPSTVRFQLAPVCQWQRQLKRAGCNVHNTLDWRGREPVPEPQHGPCWLLPAQDEAAEDMAYYQKELRRAGWKLLTCNPEVIATLRSKAELHVLADNLGLNAYMPDRYPSPAEASYPCVLKPSRGTWGKGTHIVYSSDEVLRTIHPSKIYEVERQAEQQLEYRTQYMDQGYDVDPDESWAERAEAVDTAVREWMEAAEYEELGADWVLQELAPGYYEYSTSLLVDRGRILDAACSRYEYSSDVYVWPVLEYLKSEYVSVPKEHLDVMSQMLVGFSGICNFNYKIRPCGKMCIFEVNPRVGGDLVFDVPKKRVRAMFEKLDAMFS